MRARQRLSSGDMLLLELVFAIIFFSLSIAATMSVFGTAYELSSGAADKNRAVTETNAAAEIIRSSDTVSEADKLLKKGGFTGDASGVYTRDYGDGRYRMKIETALRGRLYTAGVACYKKESGTETISEPIYSLTVEHAMKGETADGR